MALAVSKTSFCLFRSSGGGERISAFYESIAEYYDDIFPLVEEKVVFVESLSDMERLNILDVGCSTGSLAISLAGGNHRITGIDLDKKMITMARQRAASAGLSPVQGKRNKAESE